MRKMIQMNPSGSLMKNRTYFHKILTLNKTPMLKLFFELGADIRVVDIDLIVKKRECHFAILSILRNQLILEGLDASLIIDQIGGEDYE